MVDAAGEVYPVGQHLFLLYPQSVGVPLDQIGQFPERLFRAFKREWNILLVVDDLALEVGHGYADVVPADVRPDKIPGSLIKSEYAGTSAAGCAGLPQILKKSVLDQLSDESCHCRYAGVEFLAEFRDAEIPVVYAKTEDPLLHNGSLALDVVKE